jgi:hypothetical protein
MRRGGVLTMQKTQATALNLALEEPRREYEFSEADFRVLARIAKERTGITLAPAARAENVGVQRVSRISRWAGR